MSKKKKKTMSSDSSHCTTGVGGFSFARHYLKRILFEMTSKRQDFRATKMSQLSGTHGSFGSGITSCVVARASSLYNILYYLLYCSWRKCREKSLVPFLPHATVVQREYFHLLCGRCVQYIM